MIKNFAMFTCRSKVCLLLKLMKIEIFLQLVRVKVQNDHKLTEYILNEFLLHLKNDFCIKGIQLLKIVQMQLKKIICISRNGIEICLLLL